LILSTFGISISAKLTTTSFLCPRDEDRKRPDLDLQQDWMLLIYRVSRSAFRGLKAGGFRGFRGFGGGFDSLKAGGFHALKGGFGG
jgi:hypothetical protein